MQKCPVCDSEIKDGEARCSSCGFKLPGATEEFQPISFNEDEAHVEHSTPKSASIASLLVVSGPTIGTSYLLDDKELSIGRSPQCDIFLNDMTVSRGHASVKPSAQGFVITDNQSFNGIWINNESIESALLKNGDIIQIGSFCLKFEE